MRIPTLVQRNLAYYWRSNFAVICGIATSTAVLAGALLVGDSVRASLRQLVLDRLGQTSEVIMASRFFRAELATDLKSQRNFAAVFADVCPLITLEGFVTNDENNQRAGDVQVYGIDERFFNFHGATGIRAPIGDESLISPGLAAELETKAEDTLLLRIEKPSTIPVESLHGHQEDIGITLRSTVRAVLPAEGRGEFSLRPQQFAVRAIFLPLARLQRNLEQEGKVNSILLKQHTPSRQAIETTRQSLKEAFTLADLGLRVRMLNRVKCLSFESESTLIDVALTEKVRAAAEIGSLRFSPVLTYLANTLQIGARTIPYSLVTAVEEEVFQRLKNGSVNMPSPLLLNDWAAQDLNAKLGQTIRLDYFLWHDEGRLETQSAEFQVDGVIPLIDDRDYAPEYPGITEAMSLADWEPPFPVDLSRIRPRDEEYWDKYRTTPKAFILLSDGQRLWQSRYGKLTSIRLFPSNDTDLTMAQVTFTQNLRALIDPFAYGFAIYPAREQGLAASHGATDFGQYFTYFSFFIVISALLLAALFFRLGVEQRLSEIGLLRAIGFHIASVRNLLLCEGLFITIIGSIVGMIGAIAYGQLMMYGLRTWWIDATSTTALKLHIAPLSLAAGGIGGILIAILCIAWTLHSLQARSPRNLFYHSITHSEYGINKRITRRLVTTAVIFNLFGLAFFVAAALKFISQVAGFFGSGMLLLIAILNYWALWLQRNQKPMLAGCGWRSILYLGLRNTTIRAGRSVLCIALISAATFIIVAIDSFRHDSASTQLNLNSGTGGYTLIAESLLPIVYDPNHDAGRENLNLYLNDGSFTGVAFTRFRLRPGDDASCLNLYQPQNPRLLGATSDFIHRNRFSFQSSLAETSIERDNPWLLLKQEAHDGTIPVIADANSMTYVLHSKLGDEITIATNNGKTIRLRLVAALSNSIFQSELIMSEENFLRLFPEQEGYRFFLIDAPIERAEVVSKVLEERLSDFGVDAIKTAERLAGFHRVENTYLSTFQMLGGFGLLLGTIGLAAVLVRNVIERRRELALLRAIGYQPMHLAMLIFVENAFLLVCGLLTGLICALIAIAPAFIERAGDIPTRPLLLLLLILMTGLTASLIAVRIALRKDLLPALRAE